MHKGLLLVISGPSGVGKGTICSALRQAAPELVYSVSATTRQPRQGEQEGINYFFKSREQFQDMIKNDHLLEWAEYVGNYYGTPRHFVEDTLNQGKDIILEIEVQGALKVKQKFPQGIFIFIMPPSIETLKERILMRGSETEESMQKRLRVASEEIKLLQHYDYAVENDRIEYALERIRSIIIAEHCKRERFMTQLQKWHVGV